MVSRFVAPFLIAGTCIGVSALAAAQDRPPDVQEGVEVQTRGPVHEAFAETVSFNPEPGTVVKKAPPPQIEEVPPDQRPEGANVAWIPGYWAWDDERNDFLWVSGVWRVMPPDREWVSGYWRSTEGGYQWMSGYWADAKVSESVYLPEPPESVEAGPNVPPPSLEYIWAPGCWVWHEGRYAWQPGYWVAGNPEWIWVPSHYVYSPRGYVFCEGYWDYAVGSRGVLFAPVYFEPHVYARPAFHYSPVIAIDLTVFLDHLFVRPSCHHYYFGDYYAPHYYNDGIYASFTYHFSSYGYDPIHVNEVYRHRADRGWDREVRQTFLYRREHEEARPPRTMALQVARGTATEKSIVVGLPLEQMAKNKDHPIRLQPVTKEEKPVFEKRGQDIEVFRGERTTLESTSPGRATSPPTGAPSPGRTDNAQGTGSDKASKPESKPSGNPDQSKAPDRAVRPKSPIVAKHADQLSREKAPPRRPEPPRPDTKVQATPKNGNARRPDPVER